ncbi:MULTISPECIES: hypothetical protein [Ureibacillus]|uniref:Uncharacterized protein n=1 Tax=Ureibacillus thermosphaericus TaxID=51173 RepID=A0A840PVA8_URETH|nr:hypothetical protein [Ureibacillus thermosphaericus]MBB5148662.1 hypothetical protein [Ureibacillus thermosphaericus]NKZ31378.1 hypothetical protein [Ureibacillus thermosphaericus]
MNLAKVGEVVAIYPERHSARVRFSQLDDKVSAELPILAHVEIPKINDPVLCLYTSKSEGFILGTFYNELRPPLISE